MGKTAFRFMVLAFGLGMMCRALAAPADSVAEGAAWLRAQPAQNLTLQLVAVDAPGRIAMFIRRHHLSGELAQLSVRQGKGNGYILVLGSYADRKAATAAAKRLPIKPWIRAIGGIQRIVVGGASLPALPAPVDTPIKDAAWIWSQDPSHHTLQLAAGANRKALEKLAGGLTAQGPVAIYRKGSKGKTTYAVIFGDFDSVASATAAIKQLSPRVRQGHPAIRSFASIQDSLSLSSQ